MERMEYKRRGEFSFRNVESKGGESPLHWRRQRAKNTLCTEWSNHFHWQQVSLCDNYNLKVRSRSLCTKSKILAWSAHCALAKAAKKIGPEKVLHFITFHFHIPSSNEFQLRSEYTFAPLLTFSLPSHLLIT